MASGVVTVTYSEAVMPAASENALASGIAYSPLLPAALTVSPAAVHGIQKPESELVSMPITLLSLR